MAMLAESPYKQKLKRLQEFRTDRSSWDTHWRELQKFFLPRRGRWLEDKRQTGSKKHQDMLDPTPKMAARTLAAGMMAGSTNPSQPWFRLGTPDPEMMEFPAVSRWLYSVENRMRSVFDKSNLYKVLPLVYGETGVFGTSPLIMVEDAAKTIRFIPNTIGSFYLAQDEQYKVNTLYREYKITTRNMVAEFGIDNVPERVRQLYNGGTKEQWHSVLHVIEPRTDSRYGDVSARGMDYASCYYDLEGNEQDKPLRESGFEDNPLAVFRWETTAEDVYGSSPGMDALGLAKAVQVQQKRKAAAIDKLIDPPMVGDPQFKREPSSVLPGSVTWHGFTANGSAPRFAPAYTIKPEVGALLEDIQDIRELTNECMYVDLFLMFTSMDRRQITAEEITKRYEEKLLMLGPALGNHKTELIEPIIDRTFNIMARQGQLPDPPQELEGVELKVEMISPLAQAQKLLSVTSMERFGGYVGGLAKAQAESGMPVTVFDKVDFDQSIDEYAGMVGVPPTIVRDDDAVAALRKERAQAEQAQQAVAAAPALKDAAEATEALSRTNVKGKSMLDRMSDAA